jgi:hypothetical protein
MRIICEYASGSEGNPGILCMCTQHSCQSSSCISVQVCCDSTWYNMLQASQQRDCTVVLTSAVSNRLKQPCPQSLVATWGRSVMTASQGRTMRKNQTQHPVCA